MIVRKEYQLLLDSAMYETPTQTGSLPGAAELAVWHATLPVTEYTCLGLTTHP